MPANITFLDQFKFTIGYTSEIDQDNFLINQFLKPAIDRATALTVNYKVTQVTLSKNPPALYDLTQSSIATPTVSIWGIQDLIYDRELQYYYTPVSFKEDYQLIDLTILSVVKNFYSFPSIVIKYNQFYSKPYFDTSNKDTYVETDMPTRLWAATIKLAENYFFKHVISSPSNAILISEENVRRQFASHADKLDLYTHNIQEAEHDLIRSGASSKSKRIISHNVI